jgi:hypothetical protein
VAEVPAVAPTYREVVLKRFAPEDKPLTPNVEWKKEDDGTTVLVLDPGAFAQMERELKAMQEARADNGRLNEQRLEMQQYVHHYNAEYLLFEIPNPGIERCILLFRARIKTRNFPGTVKLNIATRSPASAGESYATMTDGIGGSTDWASCQVPLEIGTAEKPDLIRLKCLLSGEGEAYAKDLELVALYPQTR